MYILNIFDIFYEITLIGFSGLAMLDGFVYAVGGWEGSSRLDSVERYDPESNVWNSVSNLKMAVTSPAVVAHEGSSIIIDLHFCCVNS